VNKLTDIEKYGREGRIDEEYHPPEEEPFTDREHLRSWLFDPQARDQFVMFRGDNVGVFWNNKKEPPEPIVDRNHWTQLFVSWSPQGTYLASIHQQGVQLWGGPSFKRIRQFPHPFVSLIEFSPGESYITTWSNQPITVEEGKGPLSIDEEGKHIIIWDIATGKPLRSFHAHDLPPPPGADAAGLPPKPKVQWPAFKWSADEKYVARMKPQESVAIYELPRMNLLDKAVIKVEGIMDFEWAPAITQREGIKSYESLLCYWTPEIGSKPASVALMSVPSKEIVRTRNLFNVTDAKLHWQSEGKFICVKVDRHSKSKKSVGTNLEIFRIREKGVPVEVVDSLKDTVINFAWEPKGDRFVLITAGEAVAGSNVAAKTAVSFFAPEKVKGPGTGGFKHVKTFDKKNSNGIYWSPKGRFVVVATVSVQAHSDLDFYDMDFEGEKPENEPASALNANLMLMNTEDHYGVTDVDWDPTGRYVTTSASVWTHQVCLYPTLQTQCSNPMCLSRWKMATESGPSTAPSCPNTPPKSSNSFSGALGQQLSSPKKSNVPCAVISANTAGSSKNWIRKWKKAPIKPLLTRGDGSSWSGTVGSPRSGSCLQKSGRSWALKILTRSWRCRERRVWRRKGRRLSRRAWRKFWTRRRRWSCRDCARFRRDIDGSSIECYGVVVGFGTLDCPRTCNATKSLIHFCNGS
jgi:translation initiation factor 3 subunit B